ncbi:MAG TPA: histidine kinase [Candidatus Solibacter sp.]|jgi:signal transduction histidine kinase|nr:histidine kinase [Candidatus Solibacter sp.]
MDAGLSPSPDRSTSTLPMPAAVGMALLLVSLLAAWVTVTVMLPGNVPVSDATGAELVLAVPLAAGSAVALLLVIRKPKNVVGWLMTSAMVVLSLLLLGNNYTFDVLYGQNLPASLIVPLWYVSTLGWSIGFSTLLVVIPLVFPDGKLLSKRWRPVLWLVAAGAVVGVLTTVLDPQPIGDQHRHVANPLGISGAHDLMQFLGGPPFSILLILLMISGVISVAVRYRRAGAELRQQLKWFLAAVVLGVACLIFAFVTNFSPLGFVVSAVGFAALPVGIAIGVLKYRLYDIDVVISRAVIFGSMAVFITIVYISIVVGIGSLVGSTGRSSVFLSVVATAVVGVAFQPVFGRARRIANRLVYGKRATPYEVLADLSDRMVETYGNEDVLSRVARTIAEATGATRVDVHLRVAAELRSAAVWPAGDPPSPSIPVAGDELPSIAGVDYAVAVRHQGELLGALTVTKRSGESLSPIEEKLVGHLAAQAGLVLKNVGLTSDLRARVEELRASRQRLVTAQDAERRRIERNLHDGAQQNLVALKVKLGLLEALTRKDPVKAAELAAQVKDDADEALQTLRDLARGIYPPLLAEQGLVAALTAQVRKVSVPVEVQADGVARYPQELEAAVYFCCLEALQNVAKYARASGARVRLSAPNGRVEFEVEDNGTGFDPETTAMGSGLQNMTDRISALGGSLSVRSSVAGGTTVAGSLPIPQPAAA